MALTTTNSDKFQEVLAKCKITSSKLRNLINKYVEQHGTGDGAARAMQAAAIRKELNREVMNDAILTKGLKIVGLNEVAIAEVINQD